jgi:hypothetical protein
MTIVIEEQYRSTKEIAPKVNVENFKLSTPTKDSELIGSIP